MFGDFLIIFSYVQIEGLNRTVSIAERYFLGPNETPVFLIWQWIYILITRVLDLMTVCIYKVRDGLGATYAFCCGA